LRRQEDAKEAQGKGQKEAIRIADHRNMLLKINRLKKENDFRKILRRRDSARESFLILKNAPNGLGIVRVGISVSKKVSKKAILRNKIKRRLAALVGPKIPQIKGGLDIFLIALPGLETKKFLEMREICEALFKKAKILTMSAGRQENNGKSISKNN